MATIRFETGQVVNFEGTPTPQDIEEVAIQLGISPAPAAPKQGFVERVGEKLDVRKDQFAKTAQRQMSGEQNLAETAIQGVGQGIGAAFDVATEVPVLKQILGGIGSGLNKLSESKPIKAFSKLTDPLVEKAYNKYEGLSEKDKATVNAAGNIASIAPIGKAAQVATQGATKVGQAVKAAVPKATEAAKSQITQLGERSIKNYESDLTEFFTGTKSGTKIVTNEQLQGKNTASFLANKLTQVKPEARGQYIPKVKNGTFQPEETVKLLRTDAEMMDNTLADILKTEGKIIDLEAERLKMLNAVRTESRIKRAEVSAAERMVNETMDEYIRQFGTKAPIAKLQWMKQGLYSKGYADFDPSKGAVNLQKSVARDMAKVSKETIEENVDNFEVRALNKEIGDHYSAIDSLEKRAGSKVKGGRLGRYSARFLGGLGGYALGSFYGVLGGAVTADVVMKILMDTSLSGPVREALIKQIRTNNPSVLEEALKKVEANRSGRLLPSGDPNAPKSQNFVPINLRAPYSSEPKSPQNFNQNTITAPKNLLPKSNPIIVGAPKPTALGSKIPKELQPLAIEARKYKSAEEFRANMTAPKLRQFLNETSAEGEIKTASSKATGAKTRKEGDYLYSQDRGYFDAMLNDIKSGRNLDSGAPKDLTDFYNKVMGKKD